MLFDFCYLVVLCAIILITFFQVLMPPPVLQASLSLYSSQFMPHLTIDTPSPQIILLFCLLGLVYLKIIWRLINPPHKF